MRGGGMPAPQPCATLRADGYRPPCLQTIQTFGGTAPLAYKHRPKPFLNTPRNPIQPVDDYIKPFTVGTWPYDQVFRREEADDRRAGRIRRIAIRLTKPKGT